MDYDNFYCLGKYNSPPANIGSIYCVVLSPRLPLSTGFKQLLGYQQLIGSMTRRVERCSLCKHWNGTAAGFPANYKGPTRRQERCSLCKHFLGLLLKTQY